MRVALIVSNNVWFCPYVNIYEKVLLNAGVDYDIISWNRNGGDKERGISYNYIPKPTGFGRLKGYVRYFKFVKKQIINNRYDRLVIFDPVAVIFFAFFLRSRFPKKYIIDYRDLSIEQNKFLMPLFKIGLQSSFANVISSPGFKNYLPDGLNYVISHNFDIDAVKDALNDETIPSLSNDIIDVLTIGGIRDYDSNVEVIDGISNLEGYSLSFVGKGVSAGALQEYAEDKKVKNISFIGYYPKEKEKEYINRCTFLNIFYPRRPSHDTALSNRFYNSLIYRKPMITTSETTQGNYAAQYNVGLSLVNCKNLANDLKSFLGDLDPKTYVENCNALLTTFVDDYKKWETVVNSFIAE